MQLERIELVVDDDNSELLLNQKISKNFAEIIDEMNLLYKKSKKIINKSMKTIGVFDEKQLLDSDFRSNRLVVCAHNSIYEIYCKKIELFHRLAHLLYDNKSFVENHYNASIHAIVVIFGDDDKNYYITIESIHKMINFIDFVDEYFYKVHCDIVTRDVNIIIYDIRTWLKDLCGLIEFVQSADEFHFESSDTECISNEIDNIDNIDNNDNNDLELFNTIFDMSIVNYIGEKYQIVLMNDAAVKALNKGMKESFSEFVLGAPNEMIEDFANNESIGACDNFIKVARMDISLARKIASFIYNSNVEKWTLDNPDFGVFYKNIIGF